MDSRTVLLDTFRDNNAQLITAADMREYINAVYDEKVSTEIVIDNLMSIVSSEVLSANQGRILKVLIDSLQITVDSNTSAINTNSLDIESNLVKIDANTLALDSLANGITTSFVTATDTINVTNGVITSIVPL